MATYNIYELFKLKERAIDYIWDGYHTECRWLYRNKSTTYFEDILYNHNGLMMTYTKDQSGDPRNCINGQLEGLFFMARNKHGRPPPDSAFGPVRLQVPARELMGRAPNIYFADFYCLQGSRHYVTLVVTSPNSEADRFCRCRLLRLDANDKQDNPFLFMEHGQWRVSYSCRSNRHFEVEVFFTEDIQVFTSPTQSSAPAAATAANRFRSIFDARHLAVPGALFTAVNIVCRGSSTQGGLRKNPYCSVCNVADCRPFSSAYHSSCHVRSFNSKQLHIECHAFC